MTLHFVWIQNENQGKIHEIDKINMRLRTQKSTDTHQRGHKKSTMPNKITNNNNENSEFEAKKNVTTMRSLYFIAAYEIRPGKKIICNFPLIQWLMTISKPAEIFQERK